MRRIITFLTFIIILIFIASTWWNNQLAPVSKGAPVKSFVIQKGESISNIAGRLEQEQLIKSALVFKIHLKLSPAPAHIEAGNFNLSAGMSMPEIAKALSKGVADKQVTLVEGWRVEEMADKLYTLIKVDKKEFLDNAKEGYMFPDTYSFSQDISAKEVIKTISDNFKKKFEVSLQSKIQSKGLTVEEGLILASIVEREGRSDGVRKMIASILLKRLKIGMALNADATIQYALGYQKNEKSWWKRHLTLEDLKIDSPYNTYTLAGLPPTPICNPGLSSLNAVAQADPSTPYLYYYHDSKGNSYYAKTLEEHNNNVANYP